MSKSPEPQRKALGKGLSALLPSRQTTAAHTSPAPTPEPALPPPPPQTGLMEIPIDSIDPNPLQPRTIFESEALAELAQSIRANGVIQPLVVQRHEDRFQLVAGERRWKASKMAGLETVPVVVREFADDRLLEVALIENIQREDLNPIEVSHALDRLVRDHNLTHEQVAERTGKDRSTVTNLIRLLKLPGAIQLLVAEKKLSMGHARAIVGLPDEETMVEVAQRAANQGMSVRQLEKHIQSLVGRHLTGEDKEIHNDANVTAALREMERVLGTRVRILQQTPNRGRVEIEYYSMDDLDRIYNLVIGEKN